MNSSPTPTRILFFLSFTLAVLFSGQTATATHMMGGNIYYHSDTTANPNPQRVFFKLVTFSVFGGFEDPQATLDFGDCTKATSARSSRVAVGDGNTGIYVNVYYFQHTYASTGTFTATYSVDGRLGGAVNLQNSHTQDVLIQSTFTVDPFLGLNRSPVFLTNPKFDGNRNQASYYHPAGTDADGDSLSYKIIPVKTFQSTTACGSPIAQTATGYQSLGSFLGTSVPNTQAGFTINPNTGFITWNSPSMVGTYVLAFEVEEWRNRRLIGKVTREMLVNVFDNSFNAQSLAGEDQSTCPGVPLSLGKAPETGYTYEWMPKTGLSNAFISNPTVTLTTEQKASYIVMVKNTATGAQTSSDAVEITVQPAPTNISISQAATNQLQASGTGLTYEWQKDGEVITGQTTAQLTISASGNYSVRAKQGTGCYSLWSAPFPITILNSLPAVVAQQINVYPNPASGNLILTVPGEARIMQVRLVNSQGRSSQLSYVTKANANYTYDVQGFSGGIYLLQVQTDKGTWTQRVVLNR